MTTFKNSKYYTDREITVERKDFYGTGDTLIGVHDAGVHLGETVGSHMYLEDSTAHALADWIIANVPKPEPTPLPTKFAAVVKSVGRLFTFADTKTEPKWFSTGGNWYDSAEIRQDGFEVVFEGVDE